MRISGLKAAYCSQRAYSSRYEGFFSPPGKSLPMKKPAVSWVQYGLPVMVTLTPPLICSSKVFQLARVSPDHEVAAVLCAPAQAERVKVSTRWLLVARCPSYVPWVVISV